LLIALNSAMDRLLDGVQLLGNVEASALLLDHSDDGPHVPFGAPQALDDLRVGSV
jgi:hypothetical protein